jgi:predicted AAA+ superfamily ATPase
MAIIDVYFEHRWSKIRHNGDFAMKRLIDFHLKKWKESHLRQPLLLRGARQVGKTYTVRELGKTFPSFVEINFELNKKAKTIFDADLDPQRILREISALTEKEIIPGQTLLFFDEIQAVPAGILALRYFYEMMPELHVIAAGSLLDFAIEQVGVPVGRVQFLYMYPLSFIEFLSALDHPMMIKEILAHSDGEAISDVVHDKILSLLGNYIAIGGMPQAVACWKTLLNVHECAQIPQKLVDAYQYDFVKYGKSHQLKYLDVLFSQIPQQLGKKFKYSLIGDFRKRELEPCVDLLITAGVVHRVMHSDAHGIPLGAQADFDSFKLIFIDVGLSQFILDLKAGDWLLNPLEEFINKGMVAEALVGQELAAYEHPTRKAKLYYWQRDTRGSEAEVDYLIQLERTIIPIEVKSGKGTTLRSMQLFLESHPNSPYGIRFSTNNYSVHEKIHSYPLYAIARVLAAADNDVKDALLSLAM